MVRTILTLRAAGVRAAVVLAWGGSVRARAAVRVAIVTGIAGRPAITRVWLGAGIAWVALIAGITRVALAARVLPIAVGAAVVMAARLLTTATAIGVALAIATRLARTFISLIARIALITGMALIPAAAFTLRLGRSLRTLFRSLGCIGGGRPGAWRGAGAAQGRAAALGGGRRVAGGGAQADLLAFGHGCVAGLSARAGTARRVRAG